MIKKSEGTKLFLFAKKTFKKLPCSPTYGWILMSFLLYKVIPFRYTVSWNCLFKFVEACSKLKMSLNREPLTVFFSGYTYPTPPPCLTERDCKLWMGSLLYLLLPGSDPDYIYTWLSWSRQEIPVITQNITSSSILSRDSACSIRYTNLY